ncbi:hypothetical protein EG830_10310 [bacterium]|nr:hypothetical protein [bacterium]
MKPRFEVENPDFTLSPLTGMTRNHYIELAKYLLERAFTHARSLDDPVTFPMVPVRNYPQEGSPDCRFRSPEFEALERAFILAGPLIHIEP